jgi:hypothetical protein
VSLAGAAWHTKDHRLIPLKRYERHASIRDYMQVQKRRS